MTKNDKLILATLASWTFLLLVGVTMKANNDGSHFTPKSQPISMVAY